MTRRRRTPLGTRPPEPAGAPVEAAGVIAPRPAPAAGPAPDQEHAVIVQIDDDWLARLDLPSD